MKLVTDDGKELETISVERNYEQRAKYYTNALVGLIQDKDIYKLSGKQKSQLENIIKRLNK